MPEKTENFNDVVEQAAILLIRYYKTYYHINEDITPIEKLNGNYNLVTENIKYNNPVIVSIMLQILKESDRRDEWAQMLLNTYIASIEAGFTEYESIDNLINQFNLKFDDKGLPLIDIVQQEAV